MPDIKLRPNVPVSMANEVDHRRRIAERANIGLPHDGSYPMTAPLQMAQYAASSLPMASLWDGAAVYISDEEKVAFSNGTNWIRQAVYVPSTTDLSYQLNASGSVETTINDKLDIFVTLEDFGAVGDGSTDDTDAIEAALDTGLPIIARSGKTYKHTPISHSGDVYITTSGSDHAKFYCSTSPSSAMFQVTGAAKTATTLSADVAAGATSISVASAANIVVGDLLRIQSTTLWPCDNRGTVYYGQLARVIAISGTTITTESSICFGFESGDSVVPCTPVSAKFHNIVFEREAYNGISNGMQVIYGDGASFRDCKFINSTANGLALSYSYRTHITGGEATGVNLASGSTQGYGIVANGCFGTEISGLKTYNCRRGVDINGTVIPSIFSRVFGCQFVAGGYAEDGTAMWPNGALQSDGCGSHGGSYCSIFKDNICINTYLGVVIRGFNDAAVGNTIVGKSLYPVWLSYCLSPTVSGNHYLDQTEDGYLSSINGNNTFRPDYMVYLNANSFVDEMGIRVIGNHAKTTKVGFLYIDGNSGAVVDGFQLQNNTCEVLNSSTTTASFVSSGTTKYLPSAVSFGNKLICPSTYTQTFSSTVGLYLPSTTSVSQIGENRWRVTIEDDDFVLIPTNLGANTSQAIIQVFNAATSSSYRLNALIRNASTTSIDLGGTSGVTILDTALAGTTGTDTQLSLSLYDKNVYLENRTGAVVSLVVSIEG